MRTALFLVKNGIGFGHIRRALVIAQAVQAAGQMRPLLVSQASSLALYRHCPVRVINFPLLHRVPSAVAEDWYTDVLNRLVQRVDPAVVIEDTYPDPRYQHLPALADRPRLLIMRRLDGLSFDQIRARGSFDHYDQVLIAQDEQAFHEEGHSGESLTAVQLSGRFSFVGNIAYIPSQDEIAAARAMYARDGAPLVVVNGGAGGDQMPDGYGDRLFSACHQLAVRLAAEGHPARFVLVVGPYYAGRPLPNTPNLVVRTYEPKLAALLAGADVAVIKPGNNALSEALCGSARLVLVPDVSFMEGVNEHAARIVNRYGGAVSTPDTDSLDTLIREALTMPPRATRTATSATTLHRVVDAIHTHDTTDRGVDVPAKALLLVVIPPRGIAHGPMREMMPPSLRGSPILDEPCEGGVSRLATIAGTQMPSQDAAFLDGGLPDITPQDLANTGVRLVLHLGGNQTVKRWLRLNPSRPALLTAEVQVHDGPVGAFERLVSRLLRHQASAVLALDLRDTDTGTAPSYLDRIAKWLDAQPIRVVNAASMSSDLAQQLMTDQMR